MSSSIQISVHYFKKVKYVLKFIFYLHDRAKTMSIEIKSRYKDPKYFDRTFFDDPFLN